MQALLYSLEFEPITCCDCHMTFMVTSETLSRFKSSKCSFWCPSCNTRQSFSGDNKEDKLRKEVEKLERRVAFETTRRNAAEKSASHHKRCASAQKAAKTRLKKRVSNGVCPCCHRTFSNLARHMKSKHPEES